MHPTTTETTNSEYERTQYDEICAAVEGEHERPDSKGHRSDNAKGSRHQIQSCLPV